MMISNVYGGLAKQTAGVDVKGPLQIMAVEVRN
jgi:hypothetical protein